MAWELGAPKKEKSGAKKANKGETFRAASARRWNNMGIGIGAAGSFVGNAVANPFRSMRRKHHRAVDHLNLNRESYEQMGTKDRVKWTLTNPFARAAASRKKDDTYGRAIREINLRDFANQTANIQEREKIAAERTAYMQTLAAQGMTSQADKEKRQGGAEKYADLGAKHIGKAKGGIKGVGKGVEALGLAQVSDQADGIMGEVGSTLGMVSSADRLAHGIMDMRTAGQLGDKNWEADSLANTQAAVTGLGKGAFKVIEMSGKLAGDPALQAAAGTGAAAAGVATGSIIAGKGIYDASVAGKRASKMKARRDAISEQQSAGTLPVDEDTRQKYLMIDQLGKQAKIDAAQGGFDIAKGALTAAGGVAVLSGGGAIAGGALLTGAAATGMAQKIATSKMKKKAKKETVDAQYDLQDEIYRLSHAEIGPKLDEREAKHVALLRRGFITGKRGEAYQHTSMKHSNTLATVGAQVGSEGEEARGILGELGVKEKNGQYSMQAIGPKFGMERGKSMTAQMQAMRDSRTANPFGKSADKNQQKKMAKEEKKQTKMEAAERKKVESEAMKRYRKMQTQK